MPTHYDVLQVQPAATDEAIEQAFKRLARQYHPDVSTLPDALERMQAVNAAYHVLKDPKRRRAYDLQLRSVAGNQANQAQASPRQPSSIEAQFYTLWQQCYPLIQLDPDKIISVDGQAIEVDFVYEPYHVAIELGTLDERTIATLEQGGWHIISYPMVNVYLDLDQRVHEVYQRLAAFAYEHDAPAEYAEKQREIDELEDMYYSLVDADPATKQALDTTTPLELLARKISTVWRRWKNKSEEKNG